MRSLLRYVLPVAALLCALSLLSACGDGRVADVSASGIAEAVDAVVNQDGAMDIMDEKYISGAMKMDVSNYEDFTVKINTYGVTVAEYGIFKGKDEKQARDIKASVDNYLQMRLDSWMDQYTPQEKIKVESAESKQLGNYVIYTILSAEDKAAVFQAFESRLKEG